VAKYERGLNRELVAAVNSGIVSEPFTVADVRRVIRQKGWKPEPPEEYVVVALSNGASEDHSHTYKKYFLSLGNGRYMLRPEFNGRRWE
jgi:hypothetical protein